MRSISIPRHVKDKNKTAALWVKEHVRVLLITLAAAVVLIFLATIDWYYCATVGIGIAACFTASVLAEDSKFLSFMAVVAAILAGGVFVTRGWLHASLGFSSDYPTHWLVLVAIATMVIGIFAMRRWILIPGVITIAAIISLFFVGPDAFRTFQAAADGIYQTSAEREEAAKVEPSVDILTEVDKTCPPGFAIPSKIENGGPVLSQSGIDEIDVSVTPEESVSGANPELLLEKVRQRIDDPSFITELEEGFRKKLDMQGKSFNQADFDSLLAGLKVADAKDLTVPYGNVLCATPEGQIAHAALYGRS